MRRRPAVVAYAAGHTHRHRVRWIDGTIPSIEVGCVKDFPGTWAEYRVYDGGILQVVHRMSTPDALAWSEQCRTLYSDFGVDYASYAMGSLEDRCFAIALR
jgi:3',5'-cyclic-AMP phosphodiesterase